MTHVGPLSDHPLDDLAAYAIDALDPAERQAVDDHLAHCSACQAELASHRETLAALAPDGAPPAEVWQDISAAMENIAPEFMEALGFAASPAWPYPTTPP